MSFVESSESRELTRQERTAIRKLVTGLCANYDNEYGCLPLDCECYMLGKCWTGAYCKYFKNAVLPTETLLEAALLGDAVETRPCALCSQLFPLSGKKAYCSTTCEKAALRKQKRDYMRKKRMGSGKLLR